jgi:hypothetical protein
MADGDGDELFFSETMEMNLLLEEKKKWDERKY